jgi:hypothetical protein
MLATNQLSQAFCTIHNSRYDLGGSACLLLVDITFTKAARDAYIHFQSQ